MSNSLKNKSRLDKLMVDQKIVSTRSQAESYIKLGKVSVNGAIDNKPGSMHAPNSKIVIDQKIQYVSRAGMKLESVSDYLKLTFKNKIVLDVGSSTGGFTDYAIKNGASKVIAVDVGTNQLHNSLRGNPKIELYEKTDIRDFKTEQKISTVLIDVSFISLRDILPSIKRIVKDQKSEIIAMMKPQFEAPKGTTNRGVVKNNSYRKKIIQDFEVWLKDNDFRVINKRDSGVKGEKGNQERFYLIE